MARTLESDRLYRVPSPAHLINMTVAREALSMYSYDKKPVFIYSGRQADLNEILKEMQENSAGGKKPIARKVA